MKFDELKSKLAILREPCDKWKGILVLALWTKPESFDKYRSFLKERYYIVSHVAGTKCPDDALLKDGFFDIIQTPCASFSHDAMERANISDIDILITHEVEGQHYIPPHAHTLKKEFDAITVMRIDHQKLWSMFCDVAERFPDKKFLAVCSAIDQFWSIVKDEDAEIMRNRLKTIPNITLSDYLPMDQLKDLICKSRMLFHPCDYDPGVLAIGDALACDVPVLVPSDTFSAFRKLVGPKTGLFFSYSQVFERFELMLKLINDNQFSAREYYLKRFGLDNFVERFKTFIRFAIDKDYPVDQIDFRLNSVTEGINYHVQRATSGSSNLETLEL